MQRESRWFVGRLHSHATAIAKESNIERPDEGRRQLGAELIHDIHNHIAPQAKEKGDQRRFAVGGEDTPRRSTAGHTNG